jgi:hypothetical protein
MTIIQWFLVITGSIGLGYGGYVIIRGYIELYRRGEFRRYDGQPARLIGLGLATAGAGALIMGVFGLTAVPMGIGLLGAFSYFVLRYLADRVDPSLDVPSQQED